MHLCTWYTHMHKLGESKCTLSENIEQAHTQLEHVFNYSENAVKMMSLSNREYFIMPLFIALFYSITF